MVAVILAMKEHFGGRTYLDIQVRSELENDAASLAGSPWAPVAPSPLS